MRVKCILDILSYLQAIDELSEKHGDSNQAGNTFHITSVAVSKEMCLHMIIVKNKVGSLFLSMNLLCKSPQPQDYQQKKVRVVFLSR